ncbi:chemotaxis protein CheW [Undibacterium terreum]|uniref:CheW-like domain-containing protein n=1 Tax=Undibacterium terreum TaxID=1224302 RepID=A0A916XJX7_9BURK|nr:chemotaxis protein CheW [Undibacterium terreum]GGC79413.1 hypothetical protein GCM10011396_28300 [Undibacterium terreum]
MNNFAAPTDNASSANRQILNELRDEFDLSFSQQAGAGSEQAENFLVLKIAGDPYALRVSEISGLYADRAITALPSPVPELIGLSGFRGQVTPVYDLASLLGYPRAAKPKWIAALRHAAPVALAFEEFHIHLSITAQQITGLEKDSHLHDAIQTEGAVFPIIELHSVLKEIQQRADTARTIKER